MTSTNSARIEPTPAELETGAAGVAALADESRAQDAECQRPEKTSCEKAESAAVSQDEEAADAHEDPNRPKGVRFALLYFCILLGSFFMGYVRPWRKFPVLRTMVLTMFCRIPAA